MNGEPIQNVPQEVEGKDEFIKDFFVLQQQEIAVKRDELLVRKDEIHSNENIALASIASQEKIELKSRDVFLSNQKTKFLLWGVLAIVIAVVLIFSMNSGKTEIAMELIKIGGAVLLGYFAGVNRGKAQILEKQNQQPQND
ncbi:hypothetical protein FHQ26_11710 [Testudinibacter sp. TR-2022]|uniref:hypothetical protein n=1 Tax=Testudinibacter sp. TR-2022 TaxID=2585029 RepID=UPI00111B50AB|nr:hypothetical protein [Testudinibacter sp. TR-2022]TNH02200.1 hypothetical protein FHQ22_10465 [Pasteurellaceae bacterium Phil31]TNH05596.1 hypothetical protein FHQ26_11710 [Testudinibacter sp. TR-2022]TNH08824.1 hypothetical protein FHQ25_08940 [Testudinibacter sp. TR-2022]TNH14480.1 hypothetical protein FHQ23_11065 [Testudinibacter sp. TR-2022]TNH15471.1 hypothetical protein FIA56_03325 [Testudinibacter sp. TR-2022]